MFDPSYIPMPGNFTKILASVALHVAVEAADMENKGGKAVVWVGSIAAAAAIACMVETGYRLLGTYVSRLFRTKKPSNDTKQSE